MNIGTIAKNVVKGGLLFFAVGALLAMAATPVANFIGAPLLGAATFTAATHIPVLWTAAYFGVFGAINAAMEPVFDKIFGNKSSDLMKESSPSKHVNITIVQTPQKAQEQSPEPSYRQNIEAERLALNSGDNLVGR